jgi:hypothetical protein
MNIICQSLYYQYILDTFHLLKSPKTFRVIITIILCCPCYMPKYVPRLEGIMHSPSGRGLCLLTLGHISAYNMDNTILLYILYCPCYMPKYVPRLEGIMHSPSSRGLCLLTVGHISAYNMDNTIYCINNMHYTFTPNETNDSKDETNIVFLRKS